MLGRLQPTEVTTLNTLIYINSGCSLQSAFALPSGRTSGSFPDRRMYFCRVTPILQLRIQALAGCQQSQTRVHVYSGFGCRALCWSRTWVSITYRAPLPSSALWWRLSVATRQISRGCYHDWPKHSDPWLVSLADSLGCYWTWNHLGAGLSMWERLRGYLSKGGRSPCERMLAASTWALGICSQHATPLSRSIGTC